MSVVDSLTFECMEGYYDAGSVECFKNDAGEETGRLELPAECKRGSNILLSLSLPADANHFLYPLDPYSGELFFSGAHNIFVCFAAQTCEVKKGQIDVRELDWASTTTQSDT